MRRSRLMPALVVAFIALVPAHGFAQDDSHWGIGVSFTPTWKSIEPLRKVYIDGDGELEGREFTIGVVRGSSGGGDWGVSFVHKPFKDGLTIADADNGDNTSCTDGFCSFSSTTNTQTMRGVKLTGVEFHWFKPFVTIADRVQIGMNLGGGIARVEGTVDETFAQRFRLTNNGVVIADETFSQTDAVPAEEILRSVWGLGKVEAQVAFIVAPAFKIKVSGGMNLPAAPSFRVGGVVLFGRD